MANGLGSVLGGVAGGAFGGPVGAAIGSAAGSMLQAGISNIGNLRKTETDKLNEKRLAELKRQQELGQLGLTEAEKQALFGTQQAAIQNIIQQNQQTARAAGASGMQTGAGTELIRVQAAQEAQAKALANVQRETELRDLDRKRELEAEIFQRQAAADEAKQQRMDALAEVLGAGTSAGIERYGLEKTIGKQAITPEQISALAKTFGLPEGQVQGFMEYAQNQGFSSDSMKYLSLLSAGGK